MPGTCRYSMNTILARKQKLKPQRLKSTCTFWQFDKLVINLKAYTNNMSLRHDNNCVLYAHLKMLKIYKCLMCDHYGNAGSFVMIQVMISPLTTTMITVMDRDCWCEQLENVWYLKKCIPPHCTTYLSAKSGHHRSFR